MSSENHIADDRKKVRLIDANALPVTTLTDGEYWTKDVVYKRDIDEAPTVDAVEVEKYKALVEMYHDLRENFIDYVCSGTYNVAPYCLNRCEGCVDRAGWCRQGSDECHGFNPAEVILDGAKMDGDGNG